MKIVKDTFLLYLTRLIDVIATFVQIKLLAIYLPKFVVGQIFFVIGIASFLSTLFFAGFPFVFVRFIPKMDDTDSGTLLNLSILLYYLGLLLSTLIGLIFYRTWNFWVLFVGVYLSGILPLIGAYLIGKREVKFYFLLTLVRSLILIILLYAFRHLLSDSTLGYILGIAGICILIIFYLIEGKLTLDRQITKLVLKRIGNFWKYAFLDQLFQPVFMYLYRIITPYVVGFEALASFTVSRRVDNFSRRIFQVPLDIISPEISYRDDRKESIIPALRELKKIYVTLSSVFFLLYIFAGKLIIKLITTGAYLDAYYPLLILAFGLIISSTYSVDATYLRSIGDIKPYFIHNIIWMVTFIASFVVLGKNFGLTGMAASYPIGHLFAGIYVKSRIREKALLMADILFLPTILLVLLSLVLMTRWTVGLVGIYTLFMLASTKFDKMQLRR